MKLQISCDWCGKQMERVPSHIHTHNFCCRSCLAAYSSRKKNPQGYQISFEKILRGNPHRSFAVNFRCQPFWYMTDVQTITLTTSGTFITNPGSVSSDPVITVYGNGEVTLMVGMTIVELDVSGSITLDTPLMEAYSGIASMNSAMSGDFPVLLPGQNAISWTGNVTKIEIQPNWRSL